MEKSETNCGTTGTFAQAVRPAEFGFRFFSQFHCHPHWEARIQECQADESLTQTKEFAGKRRDEERKYLIMKKLIAILLALMTVTALMIPMFASAEEQTENSTMWVNCANGKRLNVRSAPNTTTSKLLYRLDCGTRVEVVNTIDAPKGWAFITTKNHNEGGFVMTKFLQAKQPGKYEITERSDNFRAVNPYLVSAKALNNHTENSVGLRTAPNKTAKMIRRLVAGDQLQVLEVGKTWSKVSYRGKQGYIT